MIQPQRAVFFFEEDAAVPNDLKPLMLEAVLDCPILTWMSNQLLADGVRRFFVVCGPRFAEEAGKCFPVEAEAVVSELQRDLYAFLDTSEAVLVLPRAAVPMAEAGPGFAYAAPGHALQEAWRVRMTNAVQEAELVPGWVPVYGPQTIAELEPILRGKGVVPPEQGK